MAKKFHLPGRLPILWLLFAALLMPAWGFSQTTTIRCWEVSCLLPVYNQQGRVDTSVRIAMRLYIDGDLMMYAYSYGYATGEYFIFGKDSSSGMRYDDRHPELTWPFGVDSLKRKMVPFLKQYDLFKKGPGRLVSTVSHAESGQLMETYCDINWGKHPNSDSCYVTYSDGFNFLPREMSLDETMDSLYQKKLCQFKMVIHPVPDQRNHRTFDRSEWIWKLEEVHNFNRDTIESYFSRYRQATRP